MRHLDIRNIRFEQAQREAARGEESGEDEINFTVGETATRGGFSLGYMMHGFFVARSGGRGLNGGDDELHARTLSRASAERYKVFLQSDVRGFVLHPAVGIEGSGVGEDDGVVVEEGAGHAYWGLCVGLSKLAGVPLADGNGYWGF